MMSVDRSAELREDSWVEKMDKRKAGRTERKEAAESVQLLVVTKGDLKDNESVERKEHTLVSCWE